MGPRPLDVIDVLVGREIKPFRDPTSHTHK
jgi:hypothetical protein